MTGMYQSRDSVFPGRFILGTRGLRKFMRGHIVSGRHVNPLCVLGLKGKKHGTVGTVRSRQMLVLE